MTQIPEVDDGVRTQPIGDELIQSLAGSEGDTKSLEPTLIEKSSEGPLTPEMYADAYLAYVGNPHKNVIQKNDAVTDFRLLEENSQKLDRFSRALYTALQKSSWLTYNKLKFPMIQEGNELWHKIQIIIAKYFSQIWCHLCDDAESRANSNQLPSFFDPNQIIALLPESEKSKKAMVTEILAICISEVPQMSNLKFDNFSERVLPSFLWLCYWGNTVAIVKANFKNPDHIVDAARATFTRRTQPNKRETSTGAPDRVLVR